MDLGQGGREAEEEEEEEELPELVEDSDNYADAAEESEEILIGDVEEMGTPSTSSSQSDSEAEAADGERSLWQRPPHSLHLGRRLGLRELGQRPRAPKAAFARDVVGSRHVLQRLALQTKLDGHSGCVNCCGWNESGSLLVSGSDDLDLRLWDWGRGRCVARLPSGHSLNVFQAKFVPHSGDCHIVSCARDGEVRIAQLSGDGALRDSRLLARHSRSAHKLALPPDAPHSLLSAGEDAKVFHVDLREPQPHLLTTVRHPMDEECVALYSIHAHPRDPALFLTSGREEVVRVYDRRCLRESAGPVKRLVAPVIPQLSRGRGEHFDVTCAVFSHDGRRVLASYNDEDAYVLDVESEDVVQRFQGHRNAQTVKGVNFWGPRSEAVLSGSDCGHFFVWDAESGGLLGALEADEGGVVNVLEPHPATALLATSGLDNDVKLWAPLNPDAPEHCTDRLKKLVRSNERRRQRQVRAGGRDIFHVIMQRLVRQANRQRDPDDDGPDPDDSDDDAAQEMAEPARCRQQ